MGVLTTFASDPILDLDPWVGQRAASFRFLLTDAVSSEVLGDIHPIRGASLTHDTQRTTKRQLRVALGVADTAAINPLTDRLSVYMVLQDGREMPLGKYMFTNVSEAVYTSGNLASCSLTDEMFLVDQQLTTGINGFGRGPIAIVTIALAELPVKYSIAASTFSLSEAWAVGTTRGQILEACALSGDYFSPWFNNNGVLTFIRTFNPANSICDFDFDAGNKVLRAGITQTSEALTAPNLIKVVSNVTLGNNDSQEVSAVSAIPATAPNSIANRGFEIPAVYNLQLTDTSQAVAVANGIAARTTIAETVNLTTAPDPRHDSYNVIRWQGANWLELSWSMALVEGGTMNHLLRKAYTG